MTDGASAALQEQQEHGHDICIKTWYRTHHPQSTQLQHADQHALLEQYTRHVDHLESRNGVVEHVFTPLKVSNATKETDFRWLSQASKISNSEIAKYILSHRSKFIHENEGNDHVYELDLLQDFHSASVSARDQGTPRSSLAAAQGRTKPLHVYGRKSTAGPSHASQSVLPSIGRLKTFRKLLENASSQSTVDESIQSSTPRIPQKRRRPVIDSPATSSALEQDSDTSLSPSPSPPMVTSKRAAALPQGPVARHAVEPKGRQPLRLQVTSLAKSAEVNTIDKPASVAVSTKPKAALRPITRKLPLKGPTATNDKATVVHKSLGNVISDARRLQTLGGSWPLKRKGAHAGNTSHDVDEGLDGETTEIIEDYTLQVHDTASLACNQNVRDDHAVLNSEQPAISNGTVVLQQQDSANVSLVIPGPLTDNRESTIGHGVQNEFTAAEGSKPPRFDANFDRHVFRSTNLPLPPSPPILLGNLLDAPATDDAMAAANMHTTSSPAPLLAAYNHIPDISVTLATSPLRTQSQQAKAFPQDRKEVQQEARGSKKDNKGDIPLSTFLSLAFDEQAQTSSVVLPTRSSAKFRTLSTPIIPSTIHTCFVPKDHLQVEGLFGRGYLGPGRRGFWELPLHGKSVSGHAVSAGTVLGLQEEVPTMSLEAPRTIVWTLPRLRYFLARIQSIAGAGRLGVVTISTIAPASHPDQISLAVSCQSSMALMLRTVFDETALPTDEDGNEVESDSTSTKDVEARRLSEKCLDSKAGIYLVWWDEVRRMPILAA
ncbi:hypothetical protein P389DRAFT_198965 [Cystobasidium minutum MCA 4210]|uniref:uncharacterized protein n=1 Tax=Cystobasidium minutum MCA 4210 TaxID=1397322 RepID=UPI0034CD8DF3|eukprot:jgi/Rhomi1/198965/gm1.7179_g